MLSLLINVIEEEVKAAAWQTNMHEEQKKSDYKAHTDV